MDNEGAYSGVDLRLGLTRDGLWALLVYDQEEPVQALQRILLAWGIRTRHIRNCAGATAALREAHVPTLVLTDAFLPDGTWAEVLNAAGTVRPSPPVIVVSRVVNIPLYLDVLACGAYDFVVPPFAQADLAYIIRGAMLKGGGDSQTLKANR
jgi:DNA-binding NtrC family response regulator